MTLIRAVLCFDTSTSKWTVSAKDSDYFGISGIGSTLDQAIANFAAVLTIAVPEKQFQIVVGGR